MLTGRRASTKPLEEILPAVTKYHDYLKAFRDPENSGLITIIHPWESGTDNSPRWDKQLQKIALADIPPSVMRRVNHNRKDTQKGSSKNRPHAEDYYRYLYLVDLYKSLDWDMEKIIEKPPFAVKDILVNAIWAKANNSLANLLEKRGMREAETYRTYSRQTIAALQQAWSGQQKMYANYDYSYGKRSAYWTDTHANFLPLYCQAAGEEELPTLLAELANPHTYGSPFPVPSVSSQSSHFEITRYWRGPTWPIINMFISEGLLGYSNKKAQELGKMLLRKTTSMIESIGFYEQYDPVHGLSPTHAKTKAGMGFGEFSWSAAIYLYLTNQYQHLLG